MVKAGIVDVPQGRRLFGTVSVEKDLRLGAYVRRDREIDADFIRVLDYFPALKDKLTREAGTPSGGEQQMVAIGRGLMAKRKRLMGDEPSLGPAPEDVDRVSCVVKEIKTAGTAL